MSVYLVDMPDQGTEGVVRVWKGGDPRRVEVRGDNWWRNPHATHNPVAAFVDGLLPSHACVLFGEAGAGGGKLAIMPHHPDFSFVRDVFDGTLELTGDRHD